MYVRPSAVQDAVDLGAYALLGAPMGQPMGTPLELALADGHGLVFTFHNAGAVIANIASPAIVADDATQVTFYNGAGNLSPGETSWAYVYTTHDLALVGSGALWFYPYGSLNTDGSYDFGVTETLLLTPQIMEVFEQLPSEDPPPPPPPPPAVDPGCPDRPAWPYEELSINVAQGPSGALRFRAVRQR